MTAAIPVSKEAFKKARIMQARFVCDSWLVFAAISLISLGFVMVTSASIGIAEQQYHQPFYFLLKQMSFMSVGLVAGLAIMRTELKNWQHYAPFLLLMTYLLLILVLIPGIGREVNGSSRWIGMGSLAFQVSELAKLFVIIYLADYLARRNEQIQTQLMTFIKPMLLLAVIALLLLKEPDFGAATVIIATALGMMFLAGVRFWHFLLLTVGIAATLAGLAISSPYRLHRLTSFLNPWSSQFDSGYQLTQSLIAFGRGGWFGTGLGESVQKLFYLPEAHTDFVFAVTAEELGLFGILCVIGLFVILVGRSLWIGKKTRIRQNIFAGNLAYGLSLWLGLQALISMGVNSGALPTKGLTLPFMSYGGSSVVVMCMVIAFLFRIDYERRLSGEKK